jgi:hypothetical protein
MPHFYNRQINFYSNFITMAKAVKPSDEEHVKQHIEKLDTDVKPVVTMLRTIILDTDKDIGEQIKWNNPCFYYTGNMKPFDPKEYKREIAVFNLFKNRIMLVLPSGAKVTDGKGLLEGSYNDGRRTITFKDLDDVKAKQKALQAIIKEWLSLVEK